MKVKTNLLNEEAVLTSKSKRQDNKTAQFATTSTSVETEKDDEIALVSALKITGKKKTKKESKEPSNPTEESKDTALFSKGKGGKGGKKGNSHPKGNQRWSPHVD